MHENWSFALQSYIIKSRPSFIWFHCHVDQHLENFAIWFQCLFCTFSHLNCRMVEPAEAVEDGMVENKVINNITQQLDEQCSTLEQKHYECMDKRKRSLKSRYIYGIVFLITNLIAWFFRDYGERLLPLLHCKSRIICCTWNRLFTFLCVDNWLLLVLFYYLHAPTVVKVCVL